MNNKAIRHLQRAQQLLGFGNIPGFGRIIAVKRFTMFGYEKDSTQYTYKLVVEPTKRVDGWIHCTVVDAFENEKIMIIEDKKRSIRMRMNKDKWKLYTEISIDTERYSWEAKKEESGEFGEWKTLKYDDIINKVRFNDEPDVREFTKQSLLNERKDSNYKRSLSTTIRVTSPESHTQPPDAKVPRVMTCVRKGDLDYTIEQILETTKPIDLHDEEELTRFEIRVDNDPKGEFGTTLSCIFHEVARTGIEKSDIFEDTNVIFFAVKASLLSPNDGSLVLYGELLAENIWMHGSGQINGNPMYFRSNQADKLKVLLKKSNPFVADDKHALQQHIGF